MTGPAECRFYHSMDLPSYGHQAGLWDLRGRFDEYVGGVDFERRTVLDVGAASGFLSFEAEARGGRVVSVEAADSVLLDRLPFSRTAAAEPSRPEPPDLEAWLGGVKRAYWLAHRDLGSRARMFYGDARALPQALGLFDIVLVGQILVHTSDLVGALASVAARCRTTLVIAEGMLDDEQPVSRFLGDENAPHNSRAFWHHSIGLYRRLLGIVGFDLAGRHVARYPCTLLEEPCGPEITTLVFRRRG